MAVEIKITIDVDSPFWEPFWAFIKDPKIAHLFLINDPKIAQIFLKSLKPCADTSGDAAILDKLAEGRKIGQVEGTRVNKEKAAERRQAIVRLAKEVWARKPDFRNNMLATAVEIEGMKDSALRTGTYGSLGVDAIRKHLSAARKNELL